MLLPLSVFMVRMFLLLHLTGLVLAGDAEKRLFFTPAWYVVFVVEVAVYLILQLRERQERSEPGWRAAGFFGPLWGLRLR